MRDFKSRVCKFFIFGYLCVLNFKKGHKKANVIDLVAQSVEHYTFNVRVLGSNPSGITENEQKPLLVKRLARALFFRVSERVSICLKNGDFALKVGL